MSPDDELAPLYSRVDSELVALGLTRFDLRNIIDAGFSVLLRDKLQLFCAEHYNAIMEDYARLEADDNAGRPDAR